MNIQTEIKADNGVNTEALSGARGAFAETPAAAQFTFKSQCSWIEGTCNANRIGGGFGLGQEHERKRSFLIESDHPTVFAVADRAPTPTELVLAALASCLTGGLAAVAQHRNIQLNAVKTTVGGDIDVQGILGMDPEIRNGFSAIRVSFAFDADAGREEIEALVAQSQKQSAVFDILTNPTKVAVSVACPPAAAGASRRGPSPPHRTQGPDPMNRMSTLIVGAGQAGLAMSHARSERAEPHVLIERGEVANSWARERWESLRLLTPNWQSRLPGHS